MRINTLLRNSLAIFQIALGTIWEGFTDALRDFRSFITLKGFVCMVRGHKENKYSQLYFKSYGSWEEFSCVRCHVITRRNYDMSKISKDSR